MAVGLKGTVPYLAACSELMLCCGYDLCTGVNAGLCGPTIGSLPLCTTDLARAMSLKRLYERLDFTVGRLVLTTVPSGISSKMRGKSWWWHEPCIVNSFCADSLVADGRRRWFVLVSAVSYKGSHKLRVR